MYKTEISINGKVIPVRFGAYVLKRLGDDGTGIADLAVKISNNPAKVIPQIIYYGAINASKDRLGEGISINDVYDWLDEVEGGLLGAKVAGILGLFTSQLTANMPKKNSKKGK